MGKSIISKALTRILVFATLPNLPTKNKKQILGRFQLQFFFVSFYFIFLFEKCFQKFLFSLAFFNAFLKIFCPLMLTFKCQAIKMILRKIYALNVWESHVHSIITMIMFIWTVIIIIYVIIVGLVWFGLFHYPFVYILAHSISFFLS